MKLTKTKLKRIIKEELNKVLKEEEDIVTVSMPIEAFNDPAFLLGREEPDQDVINDYMDEAEEYYDLKAEQTDTHIIFRGPNTNMLAFKERIRSTYKTSREDFGSYPTIPDF